MNQAKLWRVLRLAARDLQQFSKIKTTDIVNNPDAEDESTEGLPKDEVAEVSFTFVFVFVFICGFCLVNPLLYGDVLK